MSIQSFINQLSKVKSTPLFDNIYYGKTVAAQHRRNNLRKYLEALQKHEVELLMVGEAPGHKGCALTGVPFTDEQSCFDLNELKHMAVYGYESSKNPELFWEISGQQKEMSAQTMWPIFRKYNYVPLMWNAFPFHPHNANNPASNRTPTNDEITQYGEKFLRLLSAEFPNIKYIYAIGQKSKSLLNKIDISADYIRHPSHGGKKLCQAGLEKALKKVALPLNYSSVAKIDPSQIFAIDEEGTDLYYERAASSYTYSVYVLEDKSISKVGIYDDSEWETLAKRINFVDYMEFSHPDQIRQTLYLSKKHPIRVVGADVLRCDGFLIGERAIFVPNTDTYQLRNWHLN